MQDAGRCVSELSHVELGALGEHVCEEHLVARGYELLARRFSLGGCEADLVMRSPTGEHVLVEVKTRRGEGTPYSWPELRVDAAKRERYRKLSRIYLAQFPEAGSVHFDVAGVSIVGEHTAQLRYCRNVELGDGL